MSPKINHPEKPLLYKLGLDIGESSIGWWIWEVVSGSKIVPFMDGGVIIFDSAYNKGQHGREDTKNAARRAKRGARRLTRRRAHRRRKLRYLLKHAGLWPTDKHIEEQLIGGHKIKNPASPYELRLKGLTEKLELFELGRALQHLAQRRGFKSNRKNQSKDQKKESKQQKEHDKTNRDFPESFGKSKHQYLIQYLLELSSKGQNVRRNLLLRKHIEDELTALWDTQTKFHPQLLKLSKETVLDYNSETEEKEEKTIKQAIFDTILNQLKYDRFVASKIGKCSLEPGKVRAHRWHRKFREFELWQRIHNLRYRTHWDEMRGNDWTRITIDQADLLFEQLNTQKSMSQGKIKELLGFKGKDKQNIILNFDKPTDVMDGNSTESTLADIFGERWAAFNDEYRDSICRDVIRLDENVLEKKAQEVWFKEDSPEDREKKLEKLYISFNYKSGYGSYSLTAIQKLLPKLRAGLDSSDAIQAVYKDRSYPVYEYLPHPPGRKVRAGKRKDGTRPSTPPEFIYRGEAGESPVSNPVVMRSMSAVRNLVNTLIKRYGKPDEIIVELAREAKYTGKKYDTYMELLQSNTKQAIEIKNEIVKDHGANALSTDSRLRYRLYRQQGDICPYCSNSITKYQILNPERARIDIDHIIPKSRCTGADFLDNLILCHAECNRDKAKGKKTPFEYIGRNTAEWKAFLKRVAPLSKTNPKKYSLLTATEVPETLGSGKLTNRHGTDTSYASTAIRQYLQCLYKGNKSERENRVRTIVGRGPLVSILRRDWGLNSLLSGTPDQNVSEKNRSDHRHHAMDALAISFLGDSRLKSALETHIKNVKNEPFPFPGNGKWPTFRSDVETLFNKMIIYHKPVKRLRGAFSEDTMESIKKNPPYDKKGKPLSHVILTRSGGKAIWSKPGNNHHMLILRDSKGNLKVTTVPLFHAIKQWHEQKVLTANGLPRFIKIPENMDFVNYLCASDLVRVHFPGKTAPEPIIFRTVKFSFGTNTRQVIFEPCQTMPPITIKGIKNVKTVTTIDKYFEKQSPGGQLSITSAEKLAWLQKIEVDLLGNIIKIENLVV